MTRLSFQKKMEELRAAAASVVEETRRLGTKIRGRLETQDSCPYCGDFFGEIYHADPNGAKLVGIWDDFRRPLFGEGEARFLYGDLSSSGGSLGGVFDAGFSSSWAKRGEIARW